MTLHVWPSGAPEQDVSVPHGAGEPLGDGVGVGLGVAPGDGLGDGVGVGVTPGDGDGDGVGVGVGVGPRVVQPHGAVDVRG